jgi:hypothetical protein
VQTLREKKLQRDAHVTARARSGQEHWQPVQAGKLGLDCERWKRSSFQQTANRVALKEQLTFEGTEFSGLRCFVEGTLDYQGSTIETAHIAALVDPISNELNMHPLNFVPLSKVRTAVDDAHHHNRYRHTSLSLAVT